jgi:hypothetical protein
MNLLIMSELTDYYPNEALFEQCTWFQTGPPPVALTAANQIVLPVMTLPGAGTTTTQSPSIPSTIPTTTARPADSGAGTSPSRTATTQTTETDITNPPDSSGGLAVPPPPTGTSDKPDDQPTVTAPENGNEPSMTISGVSDTPPTRTNAPEEQDDEPATSNTQGSGSPPAQSDNDGEQGEKPATSSAIVVPTPPNSGTPSTATQTQDPISLQPTVTIAGGSDTPANTKVPEEQDDGPPATNTQGSGIPPTQSGDPEEQGEKTATSRMIIASTIPNGGTQGTSVQTQDPSTSTEPQPGSDEPIVPATTSVPASTVAPIAIVPGVAFQDDNGSPEIVVGGSTTIVAGDAAAVGSGTTFSVLPSANGIVAVADGSTTTLPLPAPATSTDQSFVRPITTSLRGLALPGATITGNGEVVAISGTTFSALPSDLGVVAISESGSTTVQASRLAGLGISTVAGSPGAYVLPDRTLIPDGSAAVVSGATYSMLPENSGIQVASNGQTSTVAIATATSLPGIGEINVVDSVAGGYVVDSSVTVIAGGSPATISDLVYSALPSGLGVLVADSNGSDNFASYIEQGISGSESDSSSDAPYIIGGSALPPAGSNAVTVSGVVCSSLPSGSGILVVADGKSTTIKLASPTYISSHSETHATATSGSTSNENNDSEAPYTGAASFGVRYSTGGSACFFIGLLAIVVML